jgi:hypothetical protein
VTYLKASSETKATTVAPNFRKDRAISGAFMAAIPPVTSKAILLPQR